jgi:hypothetical protein
MDMHAPGPGGQRPLTPSVPTQENGPHPAHEEGMAPILLSCAGWGLRARRRAYSPEAPIRPRRAYSPEGCAAAASMTHAYANARSRHAEYRPETPP